MPPPRRSTRVTAPKADAISPVVSDRKKAPSQKKKVAGQKQAEEEEVLDRLVDDEDQETGFPSIFTGRSELPELGFLGSNDASLLRAGLRELGKHLSGVPQVEGAGGRFYEKVAVALGQLVQRLSSGEVGKAGKAAKGRKGRGAISGANSSSGLADVVACELLASVCLSDVLRILPEPPRQFPSREVFLTMLRQFRHLSGPHEGEGFLWVSELIGVMELCDAFVLLVDLDEGALLPELFRAVLESVRGDTPEALRRKLLKILAVCLEEMVGNIDLPLLELILQPLLAPSSSSSSSFSSFTKSPASHAARVRFVQQLLVRCEAVLQPVLCSLLERYEAREELRFQLLTALGEVGDAYLLNFAHILEEQLQANDVARKRTVELLSDIFAGPGDAVAYHGLLFKSFCSRFTDKHADIRMLMVSRFAAPFLTKYPAHASPILAELSQRILDPVPDIRAAVVRVAGVLARLNTPSFGDSDIVHGTFKLLRAVQDRLRDTRPAVRDAAISELFSTLRHYLEKFGPASSWDQRILDAVGWIPSHVFLLYFQPSVEIQVEVNYYFTLLLLNTAPADEDQSSSSSLSKGRSAKKGATKKSAAKKGAAKKGGRKPIAVASDDDDDDEEDDNNNNTHLASRLPPYAATLLSLLHLLHPQHSGSETGVQAFYALLRDKHTLRFQMRSFLERGVLGEVPPNLLFGWAKDDVAHMRALVQQLDEDPSAKESLLQVISYGTSHSDICLFLRESTASPDADAGSEESHAVQAFQAWYAKFLARLCPFLLHPDVVDELSSFCNHAWTPQEGHPSLLLAPFLERLSDISPDLFSQVFVDSSDLAQLLRQSHEAREEARARPILQSLCRIFVNISPPLQADPPRAPRLEAVFSSLCDPSSASSGNRAAAKMALRILASLWNKPARMAKLATQSLRILSDAKPTSSQPTQELWALAAQNLALLVRHSPACLLPLDLEPIDLLLDRYLAPESLLPSKGKPTFLAFRIALLKYLLHRTILRAQLHESTQLIKRAASLLVLPEGSLSLSQAAYSVLFHFLNAERSISYQSSSSSSSSSSANNALPSSALSHQALALMAWSLKKAPSPVRGTVAGKLFKYSKQATYHPFLALQAFLVFEPSTTALGQRFRQQFSNAVLLRLRESPSASLVRPLHFAFFYLLAILVHNPNDHDRELVLNHFVRTMTPTASEKDHVKQSLARVVDVAELLHISAAPSEATVLKAKICRAAHDLLNTPPLSDHLGPADYMLRIPWLSWIYSSSHSSSSSSSSSSASPVDADLLELLSRILSKSTAPSTPRKAQPITPRKQRPDRKRATPASVTPSSRISLSRVSKDKASVRLLELPEGDGSSDSENFSSASSQKEEENGDDHESQSASEASQDESSPSKRQRTQFSQGYRTRK